MEPGKRRKKSRRRNKKKERYVSLSFRQQRRCWQIWKWQMWIIEEPDSRDLRKKSSSFTWNWKSGSRTTPEKYCRMAVSRETLCNGRMSVMQKRQNTLSGAFCRFLKACCRPFLKIFLSGKVKGVHSRINSSIAQLFFNAKQLVVLGHTFASAGSAGLDLAGI